MIPESTHANKSLFDEPTPLRIFRRPWHVCVPMVRAYILLLQHAHVFVWWSLSSCAWMSGLRLDFKV